MLTLSHEDVALSKFDLMSEFSYLILYTLQKRVGL